MKVEGYYKHHKGNIYQVLCEAIHTETQEKMIVYKALYLNKDGVFGQMFVRPSTMFFENIEYQGQTVPRFKLLTDAEYSMSTDVYK